MYKSSFEVGALRPHAASFFDPEDMKPPPVIGKLISSRMKMAYSQALTERVRQALRSHRSITEKKMFGSVVFLLNGNMLVGIWQQSLIVRLGLLNAEQALKKENIRAFDVTGQPMKGWIMVEPDGLETDKKLAEWIEQSMTFVETLPAK